MELLPKLILKWFLLSSGSNSSTKGFIHNVTWNGRKYAPVGRKTPNSKVNPTGKVGAAGMPSSKVLFCCSITQEHLPADQTASGSTPLNSRIHQAWGGRMAVALHEEETNGRTDIWRYGHSKLFPQECLPTCVHRSSDYPRLDWEAAHVP